MIHSVVYLSVRVCALACVLVHVLSSVRRVCVMFCACTWCVVLYVLLVISVCKMFPNMDICLIDCLG